jgi:hypothetical protein
MDISIRRILFLLYITACAFALLFITAISAT